MRSSGFMPGRHGCLAGAGDAYLGRLEDLPPDYVKALNTTRTGLPLWPTCWHLAAPDKRGPQTEGDVVVL